MVWRLEESTGDEVAKCRFDVVPYMKGDCLDLGCGPSKCFPHFVGIDSRKDTELFNVPIKPDITRDVTDLKIFATGAWDLVFSSHTLEHIEPESVTKTLSEWMRVLKKGGHLILYLPDEDEYPKCGDRSEWKEWIEKYQFPSAQTAAEALAQERRTRGITNVSDLYAGTPYANIDHKWNVNYTRLTDYMNKVPCDWDLIEYQKRNGGDEYSLWFVFKKL